MNRTRRQDDATASTDRRVDEICDRFEKAWRGGGRPLLEDFLGGLPEPEIQPLLFRELLAVELELRRRDGEQPTLAEYLARFPQHDGLLRKLLGPAAAPGPVLDNYEVQTELGRGGMGVVYLARQLRPARLVALKVIRPDHVQALDPGQRQKCIERFHTEATAAGRLEHEHLLAVYEAGESNGLCYYSMRYIDGSSLHELTRDGPLAGKRAAAYLEPVARAVHHAHRQGILHRDLKPHNILVERGSDRPFVTDFGLAKILEGGPALTGTRELLGTPSYMAPEQVSGSAGITPAADVYGLGATLYQVLTGRPPFQAASIAATVHQILHVEPVPPRRLNPGIDPDLETITVKCLAKEPERRYADADALAEDLRRYLHGEPIHARPAGRLERCRLWCRRHPGKAGLAAALGAAVVALVVAGAWGYQENRAWAEAQARAAEESQARERTQRRENLLQRLQTLVLAEARPDGWSVEAWGLVIQAAELGREPHRLGDLAAATLEGLDARRLAGDEVSTASVALGPGDQLLAGGAPPWRGRPAMAARLGTHTPPPSSVDVAGDGPVAFRKEATPVQLVPRDGQGLVLWDPAHRQLLGNCTFAAEGEGASLPAVVRNGLGLAVAVLTPDGTVAAAAGAAGDQRVVAAWDALTGKRLFQKAARAAALALSPDGRVLAAGDDHGKVVLWSLPEGKPLATFTATRTPINCLAFGPRGQVLAVGDSGGTATLWEVVTRQRLNSCRGSTYGVYSLAFSPDGTLQAAGSRQVKLYDTATARPLLDIGTGDFITGLAFSADGRQLATGRISVYGPAGGAARWALEHGRGTPTLRGLASQAVQLCFAPDGRRVAALGHDWQLGIWELPDGKLLRTLEVPRPGPSADNAALVFSADGEQFAVSAGTEARFWDVATGRVLGSWPLERGLVDRFAFPPGKLLLYRAEAARRERGSPPVYRVRNLLGADPGQPLYEIHDFNRQINTAAVAPDGTCLVLEGFYEDAQGRRRAIKAFDGLTGAARWSRASEQTTNAGELAPDPDGQLLAAAWKPGPAIFSLIEMTSGKVVDFLGDRPFALGPEAAHLVRYRPKSSASAGGGYVLVRRGTNKAVVTLGVGLKSLSAFAFSRDGDGVAWGNADGTVSVGSLRRLRTSLSPVGLGW